MLLDFSKSIELSPIDASLRAEIILGLRLAYSHFFRGKYEEGFSKFCRSINDYREDFDISVVISVIRQDLKLPKEQPLFLFLHIDEFQRIFDHRWDGTPRGSRRASLPDTGIRLTGDKTERHTTEGLCLFQDMMRRLGDFMSGAIKPQYDPDISLWYSSAGSGPGSATDLLLFHISQLSCIIHGSLLRHHEPFHEARQCESPSMDAENGVSSLTMGHRRSPTSTAAFTGRVFWTSAGEVQHFSGYSA